MQAKDKMVTKKNIEDKVNHIDYYWEKFRNMSITLKHFNLSEFDCPMHKGSGKYMDETFLIKLDNAREIAGVPFKINSGFRCEAYNKKVGGSKTSSHMNIPCNAADISTKDSLTRWTILNALLKAGFTRIGLGNGFIHVDTDKQKSQRVVWTYY